MKDVLGEVKEAVENCAIEELSHVDVTDTIMDLYEYADRKVYSIRHANTKVLTDMCGNEVALCYYDDIIRDIYICMNNKVLQEYPHYMSAEDIHMITNHFYKYTTVEETTDSEILEACALSFKEIAKLFLGDIEYIAPTKVAHVEMSYMNETRANGIRSLLDVFSIATILHAHKHMNNEYYDYLTKKSGSPATVYSKEIFMGAYRLKEHIESPEFKSKYMKSSRHNSINVTSIGDIPDYNYDFVDFNEDRRLFTDESFSYRDIADSSNVTRTRMQLEDAQLTTDDVDKIYAYIPDMHKVYRKKKVHHTTITINNDSIFGTNTDNDMILFATYNPKNNRITVEVIYRLIYMIHAGEVIVDVKTDDNLVDMLLSDNRISDVVINDGKTKKYGDIKKTYKRKVPNSNKYTNAHKNNRKSVIKWK